MSLVWLHASYHRARQALQWWSCRQSIQLFMEAEKIRDGLLQESFTIRRNLELLPANNIELSLQATQDCLKQIENFHQSLAQLSDRLFSAYLPDSLPLAIECLLEPWLSHSHYYFKIDIPAYWRHEPAERSLVILKALEELLRITLPEVLTQTPIYISLKQQGNIRQLSVKITYSDVSKTTFYSSLPELEHLSETFKFLTSGKCFCRKENLSVTWHFCW